MSLLDPSRLSADPLNEDSKTEDLFKDATEAYEEVTGGRGIRSPGIQVADASGGSSWRDQLKTLGAETKGKPQPAPTEGGSWRDQLRSLNAPKQSEQGDFSRGFEVSGKQLKQTAYGTAALVGDTVGADSLKEWGLKGYQAAEKEVKAISKESDSFTNALEKGEIGKWMTYSAGYLIGQVAEMGVASLGGAALGTLAAPGGGTVAGAVAGAVEKGAVEAGVRKFVGKMIDEQIEKNLARKMTEEAAAQAAVRQVYGTIGATTANTFLNATQELGSIYGDAVEQAALTGQEYSLGKVWLAGIAATAVDSWADSKALGKIIGASQGDKAIKGVAMEALKGGFREGMTEGVQTAIERWGADKDVTSKEAFKEYIDSAAVGVLGGSVSGAGAGAINKVTAPTEKKKDDVKLDTETQTGSDITADRDTAQPQLQSPISIQQKELVSVLRDPDAMAYLYAKADDAGKANIEAALTRAGAIDAFNAVKGQADAINNGQEKLAEFPEYENALGGAIAGYAHGSQAVMPKGKELPAPPSQFDVQPDGSTQQKPAERVASYMQSLQDLPEEMRNDPLVAQLATASAVVFKNEKVSDPRTWTPEESAAYKRGWEDFSTVRGYSEKEKQQYRRFLDLVKQVREKYGEDAVFEVENPFVQKGVFDTLYGKGAYQAQEKLHSDAKNKVDIEERKQERLDLLNTQDDGLRFSSVSRTPTVKDLPGAIGRVMEALVEKGYTDLTGLSEQVMKRMRMNKQWGELADQVTPNMLRVAYMKLQFDGKQTPQEVNAVKTGDLKSIIAGQAPFPANAFKPQAGDRNISDFGASTAGMKGGLAETSIDSVIEEPGDKGVSGDEIEYDNYVAKDKPATRKAISPSKMTPALREYVASLRPADQKEALLTLGGKSDAELKRFEENLVASKQREQQRQEEEQRGKSGELSLDVEKQPPVKGISDFKRQVDRIVSMRSETQFFRDTLAKMQAALDEIDNSLRGNKRFEANGKIYEAKDEEDENAYIWANMGMGKDLPQEKLMALRRKMADEIREMQSRSLKGQAELFKNSLKRIEYDLSIARAKAIQAGIPMAQVDKVYEPARDSVVAMMRELKGKNKIEEAIPAELSGPLADAVQGDFFEADKAVRNVVQGLKDGSLSAADAMTAAVRGIRNGEFTYPELLQVLRENGVDVPHAVYALSGHVAMNQRMLDHVKEHGYNQLFREAWLRSMDHIVSQYPMLLDGDTFTDGEKVAYQEWKDTRESLRAATKVDEVMQYSNDADEAFKGLLFTDYTLGRLRGDMVNVRDMEALKDVYGDPVETWFQHVAFALKTRPDLRTQIEAMIKPEEFAEFKEWLQRKEDQVLTEAKVTAKAPYFQALSGYSNLPEEMFNRFREQIALAQHKDAEKILANAKKLNDAIGSKRLTDADLELIVSDYMDRAKLDSDFELEVDGTFGRETGPAITSDESVADLANSDEGFEFNQDDGDPEDLFFKRGFFSGSMTAAQVQSVVARITNKWRSAPQITVLQNATMLPEPLRSKVAERLGDLVDAKGLFDSETGQVYLFSDHIGSDSDAEFVLFHEVYGHYGLRAFLGAKFDTFLEQMYRVYPNIRKEADAKIEQGMGKLEAIDEVLADLAGTNPDIGPVKSFIARIVVGLREIGLGRVADWISKISNVELAYYLKGAREAAQNGGYIDNGAPGVVRMAEAQQHERLSEMFSLSGGKNTAYARFNPVTQEWFVYLALGDDVTKGHTAFVSGDYNDVLKIMRSKGHVEFRKRSGVFVEDRLNGGMVKLPSTQDLTGVKAWMRSMITKYQNEYRPVFDLVDALREKGRVTERMDIKDALLRYERKTGAIVDEFRRRFVRPLESLVEEAGKQGANKTIVERYLLARHAEERNKQIARINEKFPDGGSGMKTKVAQRYLRQLQKEPYWQTLEEIGRITDEISAKKLKYQLDTGMITVKQYEAMQVYKHYVNLSGRNDLKLDEFDDPMMLAGGSKFNVKGKEKRAMGRESEATDILSRTILGMEAALIRGQKNQVAQRVLAFFEANYDPNFVTINKIAYKQVIGDDGMVTEKEDDNYYGNKNVMVAKINGIPNTIEFKDTSPESFAEAIHGVIGVRDQNAILERMGQFNRIVGQMLTTWNPAWGFVNFARDLQTMYFNAAADEKITKKMAADMVRAIPASLKTAYYMARTENLKETNVNVDPEMVRMYREMKLNGGLTSFLNRKDLESQVKEIEKVLGERTKIEKAGDQFLKVMDAIEHNFSLPIEIAPRLAAYKVMRENGKSPAEAARFAGEITVNFNMRGSSQWTRQMYLFFNPAVQGSAKLLSLFGTLTPDYKLKFKTKGFAYVGMWIGLGAMMNLIGRAMGDDDDAGRNALDKVPVWKRATSMVIKPDMPGAAIPIPYGWNAFYAMGHFMMDSLLGIQPLGVTTKRIAKTALESFAPLGTAGLDSDNVATRIAKGIAPTAALPIIEWMANENRYGAPIYRSDSMFGGAKLPDSEMAFRSVNPISRAAMQGLNEAFGGGNKFKSGTIDINPAAVDFIISSYMPGFINESYKAAGLAARVSRGEEVKNTPMPLVDRFTAKVPESYDAGSFRRAKEMVETKYNEWNNMPGLRKEISAEYPGLLRAHAVVQSANQEIRDLNAELKRVEASSKYPDEMKVKKLNATRDRIEKLQAKAVRSVMNAGPQFREAVMASD